MLSSVSNLDGDPAQTATDTEIGHGPDGIEEIRVQQGVTLEHRRKRKLQLLPIRERSTLPAISRQMVHLTFPILTSLCTLIGSGTLIR